jgi:phospholipid/cholesterol/gamma-HCH transport system substrate-binding protein
MAARLSIASTRRQSVGRNIVETIVGALVLAVAGAFVVYAFAKSDTRGPNGYEIIARFGRVDGLKRGADVTLSGVKIGSVSGVELDPKTYQAVVRMAVAANVELPLDTNAKIVSESLLGGMVIVLEPGGDKQMIRDGGEIDKTQDSVSLTELIAKMMYGSVNKP